MHTIHLKGDYNGNLKYNLTALGVYTIHLKGDYNIKSAISNILLGVHNYPFERGLQQFKV